MESVIYGDQFSSVNHSGFNLGGFGPLWDAFRSWVFANHRDEVNGTYGSGSYVPVFTPEAAILWDNSPTNSSAP